MPKFSDFLDNVNKTTASRYAEVARNAEKKAKYKASNASSEAEREYYNNKADEMKQKNEFFKEVKRGNANLSDYNSIFGKKDD